MSAAESIKSGSAGEGGEGRAYGTQGAWKYLGWMQSETFQDSKCNLRCFSSAKLQLHFRPYPTLLPWKGSCNLYFWIVSRRSRAKVMNRCSGDVCWRCPLCWKSRDETRCEWRVSPALPFWTKPAASRRNKNGPTPWMRIVDFIFWKEYLTGFLCNYCFKWYFCVLLSNKMVRQGPISTLNGLRLPSL